MMRTNGQILFGYRGMAIAEWALPAKWLHKQPFLLIDVPAEGSLSRTCRRYRNSYPFGFGPQKAGPRSRVKSMARSAKVEGGFWPSLHRLHLQRAFRQLTSVKGTRRLVTA